jgi:two-component system sensor histidine kinase KdpD
VSAGPDDGGEALSQAAALVAHQLGQAVAVVAGYVDILTDEHEPASALERARLHLGLRSGLARQRRIVDDLYDLTRWAPDALVPRRASIRTTALRAVQSVRTQAPAIGMLAEVGVVPWVRADHEALDALLCHLVRLAAAAAADGRACVAVSGRPFGSMVQVVVADDGPRPAPEVAARALEPGSRPRGGGPLVGAGVGLLVARRIVEAHGGRIRAAPGDRSGLDVTFTLPAG